MSCPIPFPYPATATLDCRDCGDPVRRLSPFEAQEVANDPLKYIAFCNPCGEARMETIERSRDT